MGVEATNRFRRMVCRMGDADLVELYWLYEDGRNGIWSKWDEDFAFVGTVEMGYEVEYFGDNEYTRRRLAIEAELQRRGLAPWQP